MVHSVGGWERSSQSQPSTSLTHPRLIIRFRLWTSSLNGMLTIATYVNLQKYRFCSLAAFCSVKKINTLHHSLDIHILFVNKHEEKRDSKCYVGQQYTLPFASYLRSTLCEWTHGSAVWGGPCYRCLLRRSLSPVLPCISPLKGPESKSQICLKSHCVFQMIIQIDWTYGLEVECVAHPGKRSGHTSIIHSALQLREALIITGKTPKRSDNCSLRWSVGVSKIHNRIFWWVGRYRFPID